MLCKSREGSQNSNNEVLDGNLNKPEEEDVEGVDTPENAEDLMDDSVHPKRTNVLVYEQEDHCQHCHGDFTNIYNHMIICVMEEENKSINCVKCRQKGSLGICEEFNIINNKSNEGNVEVVDDQANSKGFFNVIGEEYGGFTDQDSIVGDTTDNLPSQLFATQQPVDGEINLHPVV